MLKLIIFDCDGVLVNCSWSVLMNVHKTLVLDNGDDPFKYFKDLNEFKRIWTSDWRVVMKRLGLKDEERCNRVFYENYCQYVSLLPFAEFLVKKLSEKYKLAILSNGHRNGSLEHVKPIEDYFEIVITADDVENLKPHSEGVKKILNFLRMEAKEALVIGDRPEDLMAGRAVGAKTGAVIWGYGLGQDEDFKKLDFKPNYVFHSFVDFMAKLF